MGMIMEYKRNTLFSGVIAVVMALSLFLAVGESVAATIKTMPSFELPSAVDGSTVRSSDFAGKVLLITFFATWCPPCRQEIPTLIKLHRELGPQGFSVIGLSVDEKGPGVVARLVQMEGINYPVLMATSKTARNFGGIAGIPTSFLVDRQGRVIHRYPGYVPHSQLEKDIESIL